MLYGFQLSHSPQQIFYNSQLIVIFITARSSTKQNVVVLIKKITSSDFIHTRKHAQTHPTDPDGCLRCSWRLSSAHTQVYSSNQRPKINAFMSLRCKFQSYESQYSCCSLAVSTVELKFRGQNSTRSPQRRSFSSCQARFMRFS